MPDLPELSEIIKPSLTLVALAIIIQFPVVERLESPLIDELRNFIGLFLNLETLLTIMVLGALLLAYLKRK